MCVACPAVHCVAHHIPCRSSAAGFGVVRRGTSHRVACVVGWVPSAGVSVPSARGSRSCMRGWLGSVSGCQRPVSRRFAELQPHTANSQDAWAPTRSMLLHVAPPQHAGLSTQPSPKACPAGDRHLQQRPRARTRPPALCHAIMTSCTRCTARANLDHRRRWQRPHWGGALTPTARRELHAPAPHQVPTLGIPDAHAPTPRRAPCPVASQPTPRAQARLQPHSSCTAQPRAQARGSR
jgi:hypothetical protein